MALLFDSLDRRERERDRERERERESTVEYATVRGTKTKLSILVLFFNQQTEREGGRMEGRRKGEIERESKRRRE